MEPDPKSTIRKSTGQHEGDFSRGLNCFPLAENRSVHVYMCTRAPGRYGPSDYWDLVRSETELGGICKKTIFGADSCLLVPLGAFRCLNRDCFAAPIGTNRHLGWRAGGTNRHLRALECWPQFQLSARRRKQKCTSVRVYMCTRGRREVSKDAK